MKIGMFFLVIGMLGCSGASKKVSEADVLRATEKAEDADMGYALKGDEQTERLLQQQSQREEQMALRNRRVSRFDSSYSDTGASVRTPAQGPSVEEGVAARDSFEGELDLDESQTE